MAILALGVSYRRAAVELLERLAFGRDDLAKAYRQLAEAEGVHGGVILSTCNRVEVYADVEAYHPGLQAVLGFLAESRGVDPDELTGPLSTHYEEQASAHLFSVAAGLDSMVQGESQILGQVRQAYLAAEDEGAPGPVLTELFRRAIRTGRRARAETGIGAGQTAFVEAGTLLAERELGGLAERSVLVVGAGTMADLALRHLVARGVGRVTVLSRSEDRAARLARIARGGSGSLARLPQAIREADVVVSATGAAGVIVDREVVSAAMAARGGGPLFLLDLAVPRDVDPAAADLEGVTVANLDDLEDLVGAADQREVERARAIVDQEVARFSAWRRAARLGPVIEALYDRGEAVRRRELDRQAGRLSGLSDDERSAVEAATKAIVAKLLHDPVVRAKERSESAEHQARLLSQVFGLEDPTTA